MKSLINTIMLIKVINQVFQKEARMHSVLIHNTRKDQNNIESPLI